MFLTKKNSGQPKQKSKNSKALGGWDDDQPQHTTTTQISKISNINYTKLNQNKTIGNNSQYKITNINKVTNTDLLNDDQATVVKNTYENFQLQNVTNKIENKVKNNNSQNTNLYTGQQLAQMSNIECQCKIVQRVLAPGGIRVRQTDSMLNQFQSQAKNMNISIIGSLLIGYLYNNDTGFQIKARSLYAIQFLCKKNIQYSVYFKIYVNQIKDSPNCQEQIQNYSKIKKGVLGALGALIIKPQERKQIQQDLINKQGINFVDPGYSVGEDGPRGMSAIGKKTIQKSQKQKPKKLISPLEAKNKDKKVLEGPKKSEIGIKKSDNLQTDLLQIKGNNKYVKSQPINLIDFETQQNKQSVDLLGGLQQKKQVPQNQISFQQLLQAQKRKKNKQFDFNL